MKILTLNAGSNSLKFEIASAKAGAGGFGKAMVSGSYDDIGKPGASFSLLENKQTVQKDRLEVRDYGQATELLFEWIRSGKGRDDLDRIGHRIVHGGDVFHGPALITDEVIGQIEALQDLAPLHNKAALQAVRAAKQAVGDKTPMIAVFDTVFHQTIPDEAALYPIPLEISGRHKIRRYGFHGISHRYLMLRYCQLSGRKAEEVNLVTMHLEGGSSACAIRQGKSVDNSMGFTPLEGLMMGTRCGDIDPALVTYLMRKEGMDGVQVEEFLNKQCGLLGVSGKSADTRELAKSEAEMPVKMALEMFSYRVRKYVGAYLAVAGMTEAIVMGGGIGENRPQMRESIFRGMEFLGLEIDSEKNRSVVDGEGVISAAGSRIPIWVIPTQENLMMAREISDYSWPK